MKNSLISKNVSIDGRRTSLRLEEDIWDALADICQREGMTVHQVCTQIDKRRGGSSRTSAVRAFIVAYFRSVAVALEKGDHSVTHHLLENVLSSSGAIAQVRAGGQRPYISSSAYNGPCRRVTNDLRYPGQERRSA